MTLLTRATARRTFTSPEAVHFDDAWQTSAYDGLCFERKRWVLYVQERSNLPKLKMFGSAAFARFPLRVTPVANRTHVLDEQSARCSRAGTTFIADLRHGGGATMGIAHFAKRLLRLHGILMQPSTYGLPSVDRIAFPATSAAHLTHSWPSSMLRLVSPSATIVPVDELLAAADGCCFSTVITAARENTYFVRPEDADVLRNAAFDAAGVPRARPACAPLRACYFQRSEGTLGGRWEGGPRVIVNKQKVLEMMARLLARKAPGGRVHLVNANSSHSFSQQLSVFASCDLLVSVHGSQNANIMFMRAGTSFMELNPHKFFYSSYETLATVSRVRFLRSRDNSIATVADVAAEPALLSYHRSFLGTAKKRELFASKRAAFLRDFSSWDDVRCQENSKCRSASRNFPTVVNLTDLELHFAKGVEHVLSRLEIESKLENVLKATAGTKPAALDLFLALEVGANLYSNLDVGAILAQQQGAAAGCGKLTPEDARRRFAPFLAGASFSNHTTRSIDLANWKRYRKDRPAEERLTRLQHHLSQFAHMRTCAQLIEQHEVATKTHYDVALKMRDNTVAVTPFVISASHAAGHCRTKNCVHWNGYNDKVMVVPRRYLDGALRGPSEDFFLTKDIGRGISNSERLLKAVLDRRGVRVQRESVEQLPLVDGRCTPHGWCLVEEGKDCRPARWPWPSMPCEQHFLANSTSSQKELYADRFKKRRDIASHLVAGVAMNEA